MTIVLTALATLIVTVLAGVVLDYVRHARPRVRYFVKEAVPIELEGKCVGAYLVSLSNVSKRVVKDITCHIQAPPARLRNGGVTASQGLQYSATDTDKGVQISVPYLKRDDELQVTVIAEAASYVPTTPDIAIRSPQEVNVVEARQAPKPQSFRTGFVFAAAVAAVVSGGAAGIVSFIQLPLSQRDVVTFAASTVGLPRVAEMYATAGDVYYYNLGDIAYAWAAASTDRAEIEKYRRLISVTLDIAPRMARQSKANLHYGRGKINLLLADNDGAIRDFRQARNYSRSTVDDKLLVDPKVSDFIAANGLR